jgi:hypothetical protein
MAALSLCRPAVADPIILVREEHGFGFLGGRSIMLAHNGPAVLFTSGLSLSYEDNVFKVTLIETYPGGTPWGFSVYRSSYVPLPANDPNRLAFIPIVSTIPKGTVLTRFIAPVQSLQICTHSDPAAPVSGTFTFKIEGIAQTVSVPPSGCASAVDLPAGQYTVTETAGTATSVTDVNATPASSLISTNLPQRSARVATTHSEATVVTFTNKKTSGSQGCGDGYYKSHTSSFTEPYLPEIHVAVGFSSLTLSPMASDTLLSALKYGGGSGFDGAVRILLRSAVAALLNAANQNVSYELSVPQVALGVNLAIQSRDRNAVLALAYLLEAANNGRGGCPLS